MVDLIVSHGGKFVVRGGGLSVLEGEWPFARTVIVEFPSRAAAEAWYRSPAYQKVQRGDGRRRGLAVRGRAAAR
ncbi:MAG TPA: DUF1330 domain-containing protein [Verrucomicrobiae bacterium]|nr:DUF1330 domain-containing protein [Verrucomicrobiae bacterium]